MNNPALEHAKELLRGSARRSESAVETDLTNLLKKLASKNYEVIQQHRVGSGWCDVYVPEIRFVSETKSVHSRGALDIDKPIKQGDGSMRSPRDQLTEYVETLRDAELDQPQLHLVTPGLDPDRAWVGVITDGHRWHIFRWKHAPRSKAEEIKINFTPQKPEEIISLIAPWVVGNPATKEWVPENPTVIYSDLESRLDDIYRSMEGYHDLQRRDTGQKLWFRMLETGGMAPTDPAKQIQLFIKHCYLMTVARCVLGTIEAEKYPEEGLDRIIKGGFHAWIGATDDGQAWLNDMQKLTNDYEWRHRSGDILRTLYEHTIDKTYRKLFGEYYTPDWLAEFMVERVCDDDWLGRAVQRALDAEANPEKLTGIGVLDPACGSGSFLIAAADRIRNSNAVRERRLNSVEVAKIIASLVHGMDVHPLAVELSRANVRRRIGASPGTSLRIHLGDALRTAKLVGAVAQTRVTFQSTTNIKVWLPPAFQDMPDFHRRAETLVECAKDDEGPELDTSPQVIAGLKPGDKEAVKIAHDKLREVIQKEGNSIWAWYAIQLSEVDRLERKKVDRIVANPPWVRMNEITHPERRKALERMAGKPENGKVPSGSLDIWAGGQNATSFDIAQLFIRRCRQLYLKRDGTGRAGWLANAAARQTKAWRPLREKEDVAWAEIFDFSHMKQPPFTGAHCCAILYDPTNKEATKHYRALNRGPKIQRGAAWRDAKVHLKLHRFLPPKKQPSDYVGRARNGATIFPHVLAIVGEVVGQAKNMITVTTARSKKGAFKKIQPLRLEIPRHWVVPVLLSKKLLPFTCVPEMPLAVIPFLPDREGVDHNEQSYPESYKEACKKWENFRGVGKSTPQTLASQLDYNSKLTKQLPLPTGRGGKGIVYAKSGTKMKAARWPAGTIVENGNYLVRTNSIDEAYYLLAILNAPGLRDAIAEARESDRDFHNSFWEAIPIRKYDPKNKYHHELAELGKEAERKARAIVRQLLKAREWGPQQLATKIRDELAENGPLSEIDVIVAKVLRTHVRRPAVIPNGGQLTLKGV